MANEIIQDLIFKIDSNTASLKAGLADAKNQVTNFSSQVSKIGGLIKSAFAIGAVVGLAKSVFSFAQEIDDVIGKLDDLGQSVDLALNAGKLKAISDVFGTDIDKVLSAANAAALQFGISMDDALTLVQQGIALAGPQTEKYLKALESQAASFASLGGNADAFFTIVTDGYRSSTNFEQQLKQGVEGTSKTFAELTSQMNDDQIIQQKLINTSAELNSVWASLFDGTGTLVDELKIGLNEIAIVSFKAIKKAIVETINFFITLYNESINFRFVIQSIVLSFNLAIDVIKVFGKELIRIFSTAGNLFKAVITGNLQEIPRILAESFRQSAANVINFGKEVGQDFVNGAQALLQKEPIQLIGENEVVNQATKNANTYVNTFKNALKLQPIQETKEGVKAPVISSDQLLTKSDGKKVTIDETTSAVYEQMTAWQTLGATINDSVGTIAVSAIDSLGEAFGNLVTGQKQSFGSLVKSVLGGITKIIQGFLAQAIAAQIASNSTKGLFGLVLAGIGIAGVSALFAKIPSFASGGITGGGLTRINEKGGEILDLPRGTRVIPHDVSKSMSNGNSLDIKITGMFKGEDLYYQLSEVQRRRNNTI